MQPHLQNLWGLLAKTFNSYGLVPYICGLDAIVHAHGFLSSFPQLHGRMDKKKKCWIITGLVLKLSFLECERNIFFGILPIRSSRLCWRGTNATSEQLEPQIDSNHHLGEPLCEPISPEYPRFIFLSFTHTHIQSLSFWHRNDWVWRQSYPYALPHLIF